MTISSAKPDPTKRNWSDLNFATIAWALIVGPLVPFGLFALPALLLAGWIFLIVLAIGGALVAWSLFSGFAYILLVTRLRGGIGRAESVFLGMASAASMPIAGSAAVWAAGSYFGSPSALGFDRAASVATLLLIGILALPSGAIAGWIFWRIGVKPTPRSIDELTDVFN
jgi:hypothetical protein